MALKIVEKQKKQKPKPFSQKAEAIAGYCSNFVMEYLADDSPTYEKNKETYYLSDDYLELFLNLLVDVDSCPDLTLTGKAEGWAAGIASVVLLNNHDYGYDLTTSIFVEAFNISASTLHKRAKEIIKALNIDIDHFDARYVIPNLPKTIANMENMMSAVEKMIHDGLLAPDLLEQTNNQQQSAQLNHPIQFSKDFGRKEMESPLEEQLLEQITDAFPVEMAELAEHIPQEVMNVIGQLQEAMDELAMRKGEIDPDDIQNLVQSLGMQVLSEKDFLEMTKQDVEFEDLQSSEKTVSQTPDLQVLEASDIPMAKPLNQPSNKPVIQGITIQAIRIPVTAKKDSTKDKARQLLEMDVATTTIQ